MEGFVFFAMAIEYYLVDPKVHSMKKRIGKLFTLIKRQISHGLGLGVVNSHENDKLNLL